MTFEEDLLVHGNPGHAPGQAVAKHNAGPPPAPANILTGELRGGRSSQGAHSPGLYQCLSLSHLLPELSSLARQTGCLLLETRAAALGLGNTSLGRCKVLPQRQVIFFVKV